MSVSLADKDAYVMAVLADTTLSLSAKAAAVALAVGFSDATIAAACMEVRRTSKFRPSIAEVLDRCRAKHVFSQAVTAGHQRYADRLEAVHLVLHHTGGDPDQAEVTAHAQHLDDPLLLPARHSGADAHR